MITPTQKDLAVSFIIGLLNNIVAVASVVRWADRLIEESSVPDDWTIDLAMAKTVPQAPGELGSAGSSRPN
jgi:hypothetical protein